MKAVTNRVSDLMENDWYAEASALLADRHRRNQGPVRFFALLSLLSNDILTHSPQVWVM